MSADTPVTGSMAVTWMDEMQAIYGIMTPANRVILPSIGLFSLGYMIWSGFDSGLGAGRWPLLMFGFLGVCFVLFLPLWRTITYLRLSPEQRQLHVAVNAERIEKRSGTGLSVAVPWGEVRSCREDGLGFAFVLRPMGVMWLPKRAFTTSALPSVRRLVGANLIGAKLWEQPSPPLARGPRS